MKVIIKVIIQPSYYFKTNVNNLEYVNKSVENKIFISDLDISNKEIEEIKINKKNKGLKNQIGFEYELDTKIFLEELIKESEINAFLSFRNRVAAGEILMKNKMLNIKYKVDSDQAYKQVERKITGVNSLIEGYARTNFAYIDNITNDDILKCLSEELDETDEIYKDIFKYINPNSSPNDQKEFQNRDLSDIEKEVDDGNGVITIKIEKHPIEKHIEDATQYIALERMEKFRSILTAINEYGEQNIEHKSLDLDENGENLITLRYDKDFYDFVKTNYLFDEEDEILEEYMAVVNFYNGLYKSYSDRFGQYISHLQEFQSESDVPYAMYVGDFESFENEGLQKYLKDKIEPFN